MDAYADTSFLFSLAVHDANSSAAVAYLKAHRQPLALTPLQRCELRNALRLAVFRGTLDAATAKLALEKIEADVTAGNLAETPLVWPHVFHAAEQLGEKHTTALGVRTLDLLHVAAATTIGAKKLLTFDGRQQALAKAAGLHIGL